jgi:hypothetical protein
MTNRHVVRSTVWRLVPLAVAVAVVDGLVQHGVADQMRQAILSLGTWLTVCIIAGYVARSRGARGTQAVWVAWWTNVACGLASRWVLSWFGLGTTTAASNAASLADLSNKLAAVANAGAGWVLVVLVVVGLGVLTTWVVAAPFAMLGYWIHGGRQSTSANPAL